MKQQISEIDGNYWPIKFTKEYSAMKEADGMIESVLPYVQQRDVMVQAGGNCGVALKPFIEVFKTIYTFEPDPINFYCLNLNLPYSNVIKIQSCLGNEHQIIKMDNNFTDSCTAFFVSSAKEDAKIPMFKIDDLNLNKCDLILLDIEGYEQNALLGGENTIKKFKPVLCLEFYEPWMQRYSSSSSSIINLLSSWGYKSVSEYRTSYSVDVIFINNK
jgi:FkbM family methyltransferase